MDIEFSEFDSPQTNIPVWRVDVPALKTFDVSVLKESAWILDDVNKEIENDYDWKPEQLRFWYEPDIGRVQEETKFIYEMFDEENVINHLDELFSIKENYELVDKLYQYNRLSKYASFKEWIMDKVECEQSILKDINGMKINSHTDTRIYFGTFVVNLIDNTTSTKFDICGYGPVEKGTGVFFLNDTSTMHSVEHVHDNERLILYNQIRFTVLD
ncbi:hypothetical protein OAQ62_01725 [bacterium]|nr:hypothetical protein [bacterium]